VCTATGGVPDSHNITLFHSTNGHQLATSTGNELQSYIDLNNIIGEFICTVESLYGTEQVSLLLYEKGKIKKINTNATCHVYNILCINSIISAPVGCKQENGVY
jgi:hypothetical protein